MVGTVVGNATQAVAVSSLQKYIIMKNRLFFLTGIILGLIPVYTTLGWIYVFKSYPQFTQAEKVIQFKQVILCNKSVSEGLLSFLLLLCGALSITCFSILLRLTKKIENKRRANFQFIINLLLLIIVSVFTFFNFWTIL